MLFIRYAILTLVIWGLTGVNALAAWSEAKSENFIFVGDVSENRAKAIITELEEYRLVLFKLMGVDPEPEVIPVKIYGVKSSKAITDITGNVGAAGVYTTNREGPVFVLNVKGGFSQKSPAHQIAYHEYTHHIISAYSNNVYPRWYNEGYAEYLSTFEVRQDGRVKLGLPSQNRARALGQIKWFPMDVLLKSIRSYPYKNNNKRTTSHARAIFYAQSWLAVHYISSTEGYPEKMRAYLKRLNEHDVPADLFEQSFGMSPEAFGDLLKAYHKKNKYLYLTMNFNGGFSVPNIVSRKLTKGESEFHRGEAVRRFRKGTMQQELAEKYYARADEADGPSAQISASRAQLASERKDHDRAIAEITKALALAPDDSRILHIAGLIQLNIYKFKEAPQTYSVIKEARSYFKKAMRANPKNMTAHFEYVSTYAAANDELSKQAIYSAQECSYYFRDRNFIDSNLVLADTLMKAGKLESARPLLEKARVWSRSRQTRAYAKNALKRISQN